MSDEHWLERAIEDKLGEVIDRYRAQGKPVNNVGALRTRVAADMQALRGTAAWVALKQRYDPAPQVTVAYCTACDKPFQRGAVSAWLEDRKGWAFCSRECQEDTRRHPISWSEYKRRVRDEGSVSTHRLEIVGGAVVPGEQITITWDDVKSIGDPLVDAPVAAAAAAVVVDADEIEWD